MSCHRIRADGFSLMFMQCDVELIPFEKSLWRFDSQELR